MVVRRVVAVLVAGAAVAAAGCGQESGGGSLERTSTLVDPDTEPLVNSLVRRDDGSFLLTTNKGYYRVSADGKDVAPVRGAVVQAPSGSAPVGTFLEIADVGTDDLLGSGHPDESNALPEFLGFLRSTDGGKTWNVVSRLGNADLHVIRRVGETIYAWDAVLGAVLVTTDGGRTFKENFTPRSLVVDMVVDPSDGKRLLISTEDALFRSTDQGKTWRPLPPAPGVRMAWLPSGELFRARKDGTFEQSSDQGDSWKPVGKLPGEPWKLDAVDARSMYAALSDASIVKTTDGGRTWSVFFDAPDAP